ncbi:SLATT domain-containing protein [Pseudoduganella sp. SL102]|uniref:SLATT domain-containing protein n=1 Tax=Pseudoduganella sp. SL102 TaxID=2995154 RepID=UPI00248ACA69|nr:SLATT domain-containing protein [Pseudoduganella sp. SL102]WBS05139.1 SLATT domain-containing protein [Pseudoduganella sp. SL102]
MPPTSGSQSSSQENLAGTGPYDAGTTAPAGLQEIYEALERKATEAMAWYASRQRAKKRGARYIRTAAILLGALTAIIPSVIAMMPERIFIMGAEMAVVRFNPVATITGVAAATAVLFDRFYGFSASWGRYIVTYQRIQQDLDDFRIGWRKQMLKLNSNMPPTDEQILAVYDFLAAFLRSVNDAVRAETEAWLTDFKSSVADIDKTVDGQRAAAANIAAGGAKGALSVVLADAEELDGARWTLQIDNRKEEVKTGQSTATVPMLDPGIYKLRVAGIRRGRPVAAEYPVCVTPGDVTTLKVDRLG